MAIAVSAATSDGRASEAPVTAESPRPPLSALAADAAFPVDAAGFQALIEEATVVVILLDALGTVTYASPAIRTTGYTPDELIGRNLLEFVAPEARSDALHSFRKLAREPGGVQRSERSYRTKDGGWLTMETVSRNLLDHPSVCSIVVNMHDVTEARRAMHQCMDNQQRLEDIAGAIDQVFWVAEPPPSSRLLFVSQAYERIWGRSCASLYNDPLSFTEALHPDDKPRVLAAIRSERAEGPWDHEFRVVRADGSVRWVWDRAFPVRDAAGKTVRRVGVATDITERKQRESELRLFRALIDQAGDAIEVIDPVTMRVVDANQSACDQLGYSRSELLSLRVPDFDPELDDATLRARITELQAGHRLRFVSTHRRKDGSTFPVEVDVTLVHANHSYLVAATRDITERRRYEQSMEATVQALANMVELRDPYTAGHQRRVAELAVDIARRMALPDDRLRGLHLAATIHDIGKINVPAEILSKPGRLTAPELELVRGHAQAGYEILSGIEFPWPVAEMVRQHHERLDGSGYPQGLRDDAILLEARILAVADVIESMASHRPYRPARGIEAAIEEIRKGRGTLFDPAVVDAAQLLLRERPPLPEPG